MSIAEHMHALDALDHARKAREAYTASLSAYRAALAEARAKGCSVQEIADAAGITRQGVYKVLGTAQADG